MSIPINGRIAILDDKIEQVLPLIQELSKRQCSVSYYSNELKYLPEEDSENDVRVFFLDIHLTGDEARTPKEIEGILINYISRIISKNNFPYLLIYWSRHEDDYRDLIEKKVFESEELKERKPIAFLSLRKSEYFNDMGEKTDDFEKLIDELFMRLNGLIESIPVYNHLIEWENITHISTDKTLEEVFSTVKNADEWEANANNLFQALGISFSGKHFFKMDESDKNKNSLSTLNQIFIDTLEHEIDESSLFGVEIEKSDEKLPTEAIHKLNSKLLIQNCDSSNIYPGTVIEAIEDDSEFLENVFNNIIDIPGLENHLIEKDPKISKSKLGKECSSLRREMREHWKKIWVVVTPLCDHVQRKSVYTKIVRGTLIESKFSQFIDDKSESIFISPPFDYDNKNYVLVLQYRNFFSVKNNDELSGLSSLFRLRQNLIVEVQSKLSRHLSRQGVLYLDPKFV